VPSYGLGDKNDESLLLSSLIQKAIEEGISYIDTADGYGESQKMIGSLSELVQQSAVRLCTKINSQSLADNPAILDKSLKLLRLNHVDTLLLHNAQQSDFLNQTLLNRFLELREQKKTSFLGVSTYGIEDALQAMSQPWCQVIQVEYSILNPSVVRSLITSKNPGQEIVVRSVLCKGLLTSRRKHAALSKETKAIIENLASLSEKWGYPLEELAIRFALDTEGIDIVLVGLSQPEELKTALAALNRPPLQDWQIKSLEQFDCSAKDWSHPEKWPTN